MIESTAHPDQHQKLTDSPAYKAGKAAYSRGLPNCENPHPMGSAAGMNNQRYQWYMGWYDAKLAKFDPEEKKE